MKFTTISVSFEVRRLTKMMSESQCRNGSVGTEDVEVDGFSVIFSTLFELRTSEARFFKWGKCRRFSIRRFLQ